MRVGILTGEGTNTPRGLSVSRAYGSLNAQFPFSRQKRRGAVLVARINTLGSAPC